MHTTARAIAPIVMSCLAHAATVLPGDLLLSTPQDALRAIALGTTYVPVSAAVLTDVRDVVAERTGTAALALARPSPPNYALVRAPFVGGSANILASGGPLNSPFGPSALVEAPNGDIYVAVIDVAPKSRIVRIKSGTWGVTAISSGNALFDPRGLAWEPSGTLLVANGVAGSLLRVNPSTGSQTLLAPAASLQSALDVTVTPSGTIYALDGAARRIYRVHPTSGALTQISEGGLLRAPTSLAVGLYGSLYVGDLAAPTQSEPSRAMVVRISPSTGSQELVTVFPTVYAPPQVSVVPPRANPCPADITADGRVDFLDLGRVLTDFGATCPEAPLP
ncbi:MAG: hypothetical protein AB7G17_03290 [Phycisphaerales bacterium]